ncbi:MAG: hypothetical protein GXO29_04565 [Thermotogae bacterium]|nr:hypothetical protein [Thermotogota bacterium]
MLWLALISDAPFNTNVKVSNWDISSGKDQTEVTMAKSSNWVVSSWINMDVPGYWTANQLAVSADNGYTWNLITTYTSSNSSCWVGDPTLAADPNDPDKFYWAGMIWCDFGSGVKGEIYFCTNTGTPDNASNWSCSILPPDDGWNYFKDKPWLLVRDNGGTTEILVVFTAEGYGSTSLSTYEMISVKSTDGGATWQAPVRVDPGYPSTVAYTYYDASTSTVHMADNCLYCYSGYDVVIEYTTSSDFGGTWNYVSGILGSVPSGQGSTCPNFNRPAKISATIAATGSNVFMAGVVDANSDGGCDLQIAISNDGGANWVGIGDTSGQYIHPTVATDGDSAIYVMAQSRSGTTAPWQTVMFFSEDLGSTWSGVRVSDHDYTMNENPAGHDYNGFLYYGGDLFAIWGDDYYNEDAGAIYYATTALPTAISEHPASPSGESVSVVDGILHLKEAATIYDASGRMLMRSEAGKVQLRPGVYFVKTSTGLRKVLVR